MRRHLKTLKAKQGHSQNGAPRTLLELAVYYEKRHLKHDTVAEKFDPSFSGWSNPSRPRDSAVSLRRGVNGS